jgi:general secretion pathway protein D
METRNPMFSRKIRGGLLATTALISWASVSISSIGQEVQFRELPRSGAPALARPADQLGGGLTPQVVGVSGQTDNTSSVQTANFLDSRSPVSYRLKNKTIPEFEKVLVASWLENPQATWDAATETVRVTIPIASGSAMMDIHRASGTVSVHADPAVAKACLEIVELLDGGAESNGAVRVLTGNETASAELMATLIQSEGTRLNSQPVRATQVSANGAMARRQDLLPGLSNQDDIPSQIQTRTTDEEGRVLTGPVKVTINRELNALIISGPPEEVEKVKAAMQEILQQQKLLGKKYRRIAIQGSNPESLATTIQDVYDVNFANNYGTATIRGVADPKGLFVVGRDEAIKVIAELVQEFDRPAQPTDPTGPDFKSFKLKYISAADAKVRIDLFFNQFPNANVNNPGLAVPVQTIADFRSNTLIVQGTSASYEQVELLLKELDVDESLAVNMVRVFPLKNSLAEQIALPLQDALNGQQFGAGQGFAGLQQQGFGQQQQQQFGLQQNPNASTIRSPAIKLMTIDREGNKVTGGIMFEARVTANASNNSLIVSAPESAMYLIEMLIAQIDAIPNVETQIKVFQIINGDAQVLLTSLQGIFGGQAGQQAGGQFGGQAGGQFGGAGQTLQLPAQSASATDGMTLGNMRFAVDQRTNSIVVTGPRGDLQVVEDLLTRLDEQALNQRQTVVLRLSNAPAVDIATRVNEWLSSRETSIQTADPTFASRKFVILVPEEVSNSLIVSALPEHLYETVRVIERLDRRPPMLAIKVLLAEVNLSMLEEFGAEFGVQDSLLFDRGIGVIGFPFNQAGIGNNSDAVSLATRNAIGGQGLSNLGVGRINSDLGYGGLVLSAGSDSLNILLRALENKSCARILDKPHLMTLENQNGSFLKGQTVARISGVTNTQFGVTNNITDVDVGVIISVTPRVSQDGMIILKVDAQKSKLSPENEGVPVFVDAAGNVVRSPNIDKIQLQSTVMARSGQTIVLSGIITEEKIKTQRGAPFLSHLPLVGPLFRFESERAERRELMLILTPTLVDSEEDLEFVNSDEMDRMHWCLSDVAEVYGTTNYDPNPVYQAPRVYYPDVDPLGQNPIDFSEELPPGSYMTPATSNGNGGQNPVPQANAGKGLLKRTQR